MCRIWKGAIAAILTAMLIVGTTMFSQSATWDNIKLQYFSWTQVFHDQTQELGDLEKQDIDPEAHTRIDLDELLAGGPPKDGIPSIDAPQFDTAETTPFGEDEWVVGMVVNGEAKAYPYGILNWHEIVNDTIGGVNVSVTYCPLCDTIIAYERGETTFGVSGKLYQSCLVMYDRADDSLYAQPWALGVVGPAVNRELPILPAVKARLGNWLAAHPDSQILGTDTGYNRNYFEYPYGTYYTNETLVFPARNQQQLAHHPKEIVSYVWDADNQTPHNQFSGASVQFVHADLEAAGEMMVELGDTPIRARWDPTLDTAIIETLDSEVVPSSTAFAFVYPAFFGNE
ncbi:MAG: DUF3179 domain-containing protein [Cyanobacteria bacterium J06638_22]